MNSTEQIIKLQKQLDKKLLSISYQVLDDDTVSLCLTFKSELVQDNSIIKSLLKSMDIDEEYADAFNFRIQNLKITRK